MNRRDGGAFVESLKGKSLLSLAVFLGLTFVAAFIGNRLTDTNNDSWYAGLDKPPFNPPGWVFGVVWPVLYVLMAVAAWLGWRRGPEKSEVKTATTLFGIQLTLNVLWTGLFFAARAPFVALVEIVVLWAAIFAWMRQSGKLDGRTRWMILPYLAWTSFAALLNASIWWLNR
jgi:tryptophan-rich sensory protein